MKEKKITREDISKMEGSERLKYEIAEEMGILEKVLEDGWRSLSAKETGKIGGMITSRKKANIKK
ncbi:MAG: small, acid-soluble spore protein, alpha/beta type [Lachnospiraceae bacterium]|nr:small, acid-soluble spore protein, alpha/beta type [Lachnospiraceae bacterium]MBR5582903.1 small, acid-soluble spore protein, alpha/beta type [Lachnospiraceae bacterium]